MTVLASTCKVTRVVIDAALGGPEQGLTNFRTNHIQDAVKVPNWQRHSLVKPVEVYSILLYLLIVVNIANHQLLTCWYPHMCKDCRMRNVEHLLARKPIIYTQLSLRNSPTKLSQLRCHFQWNIRN